MQLDLVFQVRFFLKVFVPSMSAYQNACHWVCFILLLLLFDWRFGWVVQQKEGDTSWSSACKTVKLGNWWHMARAHNELVLSIRISNYFKWSIQMKVSLFLINETVMMHIIFVKEGEIKIGRYLRFWNPDGDIFVSQMSQIFGILVILFYFLLFWYWISC